MRFWYARPEPWWKRALLFPLLVASWVFGAGVALRRWAYRAGLFRTHRVAARVISVGNIVAGGAGKTPVVIHLAQALSARGRKVAVLSRGYGRRTRGPRRVAPDARPEEVGDEPLLIARRCPGVTVLVGEDRAALAEAAVRDHGAEVIVLDDGFQHLRLHRDLDIVVVDGVGNGHLLPRGPLREPPSELHRAQIVWGPDGQVDARLTAAAPGTMGGARVLALAGIARPERFRATVEAAGATVAGELYFPDHHPYPPAARQAIAARAREVGAERIVTTEKDAVKLPASLDGIPLDALPVKLEITRGAELLDRALEGAPPPPRPRVPRARLVGALAALAAELTWLFRIRRQVMLENLRRAFPEMDEGARRALARKNLHHLGRALAEGWASSSHGPEALIDGEEAFARTEALRAGGGVVLAAAHFGNFEVMGHWCARKWKLAAITRNLRGRANAAIQRARRDAGMRELPEHGSATDAVRVLREGAMLGIIVDQNMPPRLGTFVDFFGAPACTTQAAAVLARRARVPLVAFFPVRGLDGRLHVRFEGPFDTSNARACTQALTAVVEKYVRAYPEQWFWIHRRWKTRPREEKPAPTSPGLAPR